MSYCCLHASSCAASLCAVCRLCMQGLPWSTLYTLHLHSAHYSITCVHHTPHSAQYTPHSAHYILPSAHYTPHSAHYTPHSAHYILHSAHSTLHYTPWIFYVGGSAAAEPSSAFLPPQRGLAAWQPLPRWSKRSPLLVRNAFVRTMFEWP